MQPKLEFFQVGQTYTCRRGTYTVLAVDTKRDEMLVMFGGAQPEVLRDLRAHERIVRNVETEKRLVEQPMGQENACAPRSRGVVGSTVRQGSGQRIDYFTLGFFSVRGRLSANVAHKSERTFAQMYKRYTGHWPVESDEGYTLLAPEVDKRGINFRVSFVALVGELDRLRPWVASDVSTYRRSQNDRYITNNALGLDLLTCGFVLGKQSLDRVRERVPAKERAEFERGVSFALYGDLPGAA